MSLIFQNQELKILTDLLNHVKSQNITEEEFLDYFISFFKRKNNNFIELMETENLDDFLDNKDKAKFYKLIRLGEIQFDYEKLVFYACKIKDQLNYRTSKKIQYQLAKKLLKTYNDDAGIFIFYDDNFNFRFSLVYAIYKGIKREFSYYKRFTYYVNPNLPYKTFIKQVGECGFSSIEEIQKAFSIEPVTKEFYKEIQNWYFWAFSEWEKGNLKFPLDNQDKSNYEEHIKINLIRLITRIIFIWFIKEKDLIPNKLFDKKELKKLIKDFGSNSNYYNAILQNLFFATLNTPLENRGWALDKGYVINRSNYGVKNLYRYEDMFLIEKEEVLKLFKEIPFLNGGLFDCLDKEDPNGKVIYVDGFSRREDKRVSIPDYLFFKEKVEKLDLSKYGLGKNEEVRGLIEILNNYNFTTDEATEIDQEVALDPELLGKIFENLLASYNEETATTARKATGSFYTPREIVDYMVKESLKEYFKEKLSILTQEELNNLLSPSDEELKIQEDKGREIIKAVYELKIIDPACGSGAFPMGILHKLVHILQKIDPDNKLWAEFVLDESLKELERLGQSEDKDKIVKEIEEVFNENLNYPDYGRKLYLIENCIYGVDKQPIATQISRLRFFISLVIDQKVDKNNPNNYGILPLPNLETNFISADTLLNLEQPLQQTNLESEELKKLRKKLMELRHRYFRIKDRNSKLGLQKRYREIREKIKEILVKSSWKELEAKKIADFDIFDQNSWADWFDSKYMFGISQGFDIVIGNPPYVRQEKIRDMKTKLTKYQVYTSTADLYVYFYEKGIKLLKERGILSYITSNKWLRAKYGEKLRDYLKNYKVLKILDFGGYRVFEQTVDTNIIIIKKEKSNDNIVKFLEVSKDVKKEDLLSYINDIRNWNELKQSKLNKTGWVLTKDEVLKLKEKIERIGKPLKDWDVKIYRGVTTGCNDAFIIDTETRNRILANCRDENERNRTEEIIKPVLKGENIEKYRYKWAGKWIIYIPWHFPLHNDKSISGASLEAEQEFEKKYPVLYSYFLQFKDRLLKRNKEETGIKYEWYALQRWASNYYLEFEKEKVIYQEIVMEPSFAYDNNNFYIEATGFIMVGKDLKYILGLLNSKPVSFFFRNYYAGGGLGEKGYRYKKAFLENLPIPAITSANKGIVDKIVDLVDRIIQLKNQDINNDISNLEREINELVYKLYDLTQDEIKIIEESK
jgi:adenine-specific DNA-methyltransferase